VKSLRNLPWLVLAIGLAYGNAPTTVKAQAQNPFTVVQTYCLTSASPWKTIHKSWRSKCSCGFDAQRCYH
jgi:hypothetical protein